MNRLDFFIVTTAVFGYAVEVLTTMTARLSFDGTSPLYLYQVFQ